MGHHYVPQAYLRSFQDPDNDGMIWMYDKRERQFRHAPIKSVAQAPKYYSDQDERDLNDLVEGPANEVFEKLRHGARLTSVDRSNLEEYVGTMLMRVPRRRRKAHEMLPQVTEEIFDSVAQQISELARTRSADPEIVGHRMAEVAKLRIEYESHPPQGVVDRIRNPWPSGRIMSAIRPMTWRIVSAGRTDRFLTSDNPAYFFETDGLAAPQSELTFPLTRDLALLASWQGPPRQTLFLGVRRAIVKEVNRRVASGAERFVFSHAPAEWIAQVADKQKPFLSRIDWSQ